MNPLEKPLMQLAKAIEREKPILLQKMGREALLFFEDNFQRQGFQDAVFQPWAPRKKQDKRSVGRKILIQSGRLRNSIRITSFTADTLTIGTDVPYAKIHNEGGQVFHGEHIATLNFRHGRGGTLKLAKVQTVSQQRKVRELRRAYVGPHITQMPQRRYMGASPVLDRRLQTLILSEIGKTIKIVQ